MVIVVFIGNELNDHDCYKDQRDYPSPKSLKKIPVHFCLLKNLSSQLFFGGWNPKGRGRLIEARRFAIQ
jgi:hypothetical protein